MTHYQQNMIEFANVFGLNRELAERIIDLLRDGILQRGRASLVVSGGTTPVALFEALSGADISWEKIVVCLADERWVDPGSADSNERLVRTHLLKNKAAAATFIGLKTPEDSAGTAEAACEKRIRQIPVPFDLLILGMGDDGHTASLFPGAAALSEALDMASERICMAVSPPAAPHDRMTLTLPVLLNSRRIFVHMAGQKKRQVYEMAIAGKSPEEMPIRAILGQKMVPVTVWWAP